MRREHFFTVWISLAIIALLAIAGGTPGQFVTNAPGFAGVAIGTIVATMTLRWGRT